MWQLLELQQVRRRIKAAEVDVSSDFASLNAASCEGTGIELYSNAGVSDRACGPHK